MVDQMEIVGAMPCVMEPLCVVDGYSMHPLGVCTEATVAGVFARICQRGNPLLQGRPARDLEVLGAALYRKAVDCPASVCFLHGSEPVAVMMSWDAAEGGVWDGVSPPASLACHAAVGSAVFQGIPCAELTPGQIFYGAFCGVCPGHPASLFLASTVFMSYSAVHLGFRQSLGYTVHPRLLEGRARTRAEIGASEDPEWTVVFAELDVPAEVQSELCSLRPGIAECWCNSLENLERRLEASKRMSPENCEIIAIAQQAAADTVPMSCSEFAFTEGSVMSRL